MADPILTYDDLIEEVAEALVNGQDAVAATVADRVSKYTTHEATLTKLRQMLAEYVKQESYLHAWMTSRAIQRVRNEQMDMGG